MERVITTRTDGTVHGRAAMDWAAREAGRRRLALRLTHLAPPGPTDTAQSASYDVLVAELAARHPSLTIRSVPVTDRAAAARDSLTERTEMLVLGPGAEEAVASAVACPLVLVPATFASPAWTGGPVSVRVDPGDPAVDVLAFAFESARLRGVRLHALHAWALPARAAASPFPVLEEDRATWEDQEVQRLSDALRPWRAKYPDVDVLEDVVLFTPSEALLHASERAGLVVVGRREASTALPRRSHCPIAVLPVP
ncbi:universal stress protein [Streptomyces sp. NPDC001658]